MAISSHGDPTEVEIIIEILETTGIETKENLDQTEVIDQEAITGIQCL